MQKLSTCKIPCRFHVSYLGWCDESVQFTPDDLRPAAEEYVKEKFRIQGKSPDYITQQDIDTMMWYIKLTWTVSIGHSILHNMG